MSRRTSAGPSERRDFAGRRKSGQEENQAELDMMMRSRGLQREHRNLFGYSLYTQHFIISMHSLRRFMSRDVIIGYYKAWRV
jgi:hypothetical protein